MASTPAPARNLRRAICFASMPRTVLHSTKTTGSAGLARAADGSPHGSAERRPTNNDFMRVELGAQKRNIDILFVRFAGFMPADNRAEVIDARTTGRMPVGGTDWKPVILQK